MSVSVSEENAAAIYYQAVRYVDGVGVPLDYKKAMELFTQAAALGCPHSMHYLGKFYDSGVAVPSNEQTMFEWMKRASEAGHSEAMWRLAGLYLHGASGVKQDAKLAAHWYKKSAELGNAASMRELASAAYDHRSDPAAAAQALEWSRRGAEAENVESMIGYAHLLFTGECGAKKDPALGSRYLRKACRVRSEQARSMLIHYDHRLLSTSNGGVLTPEAQAATNQESREMVMRHFLCGYWGDLFTTHQWDQNDKALEGGGLIVGRYHVGPGILIEVTMEYTPGKAGSYCMSRYGEPEDPYRWDDFWAGFIMNM